MIVLSNSNAQTLAPGQSLIFDTVILHTGCGECHRPNSGSVGLKGTNGIYDIYFSGNVSGAAEADVLQLNVMYDMSALPETTMISTATAADAFQNVGTGTSVKPCCCSNSLITVANTGTTTVTIAPHPLLKIRRVA